MSNYRSAYENYYKNINNVAKGNKDNNRKFTLSKKADKSIKPQYGVDKTYNNNIINVLIKRAIKELTGATILLLFFVGLKYISLTQVEDMHIKFKQALSQNFNYNESIESFNAMQIGNIKGKDLKIGDLTTEDLKIQNLKAKVSNFVEYLKKTSTMQN